MSSIPKDFKIELAGRELSIEIKNLAEQANGSVFVRYGDTFVLCTAVMSPGDKADMGFFPLTVEYEERYYAAGKIRGARYVRREGRPSDEAICNARLVDRAIRPLFPKSFSREVQVVATVLSWDGQNDPDILGLTAASASLSLSDIPWKGPVAAVRIGQIENQFILNPTYEQREKSPLDVIFAATKSEGKLLLNMIEAGFEEVEEKTILEAYQFAMPYLEKLIDFQEKMIKEIGKEKIALLSEEKNPELDKRVNEFLDKNLTPKFENLTQLKDDLVESLREDFPEKIKYIQNLFNEEIDRRLHQYIIEKEIRPDGRKIDELRNISADAGILPRTHGSGLFCRGQTKALSILTLGAPGDHQILEGMEIVGKKRFMHHYNFPPYSSGEVKPMRGPGRREIGHGVLAEKALLPGIPPFDQFPYTIRIVTEILSSNGSTSMAAVSASSLALMDAGVPVKTLTSGIAIGLMSDEKGRHKVLTDIQGPEDHHGDMDFKLAGTKNGATALQMDVKITGITEKIFQEALERGKKARTEILGIMSKTISESRPQLSPFAPRILIHQINPDKIREVIGPGGKVINEIIAECGVSIDIEDDGKIFITAEKEEAANKALDWIKNITREVKVGEIFEGRVKRILNFGAFVELFPGQEGMVHISQLAPWRVEKVEDVVKTGDIVPVKVISVDEQGRINLSLKETNGYAKKRPE